MELPHIYLAVKQVNIDDKAVNSSKKQTNEFVFTTMRRVFVRFLEEIEDIIKTF